MGAPSSPKLNNPAPKGFEPESARLRQIVLSSLWIDDAPAGNPEAPCQSRVSPAAPSTAALRARDALQRFQEVKSRTLQSGARYANLVMAAAPMAASAGMSAVAAASMSAEPTMAASARMSAEAAVTAAAWMSAEPAVFAEAAVACETVPKSAVNEVAAVEELPPMNEMPAIDEAGAELKIERAVVGFVGVSVVSAIVRFDGAIG
jgi:hypothetical protein